MEPFLTYAARRDLRESIWRTYYSRGDNRDVHDNTLEVIPPHSLKLRAEKAALMGYADYATWKLQGSMAKTPDEAMAQMMQVWPAATAPGPRREVTAMQAIADRLAGGKGPAESRPGTTATMPRWRARRPMTSTWSR